MSLRGDNCGDDLCSTVVPLEIVAATEGLKIHPIEFAHSPSGDATPCHAPAPSRALGSLPLDVLMLIWQCLGHWRWANCWRQVCLQFWSIFPHTHILKYNRRVALVGCPCRYWDVPAVLYLPPCVLDRSFLTEVGKRRGPLLRSLHTVTQVLRVNWYEVRSKIRVSAAAVSWNCACCQICLDKRGRTLGRVKQAVLEKVVYVHQQQFRMTALDSHSFALYVPEGVASALVLPRESPGPSRQEMRRYAMLTAGFASTDALWDGYSKWRAMIKSPTEWKELLPWRSQLYKDTDGLTCFPRAVARVVQTRQEAIRLKGMIDEISFVPGQPTAGVTVVRAVELMKHFDVAVLFYNDLTDEISVVAKPNSLLGVLYVPGNNDTFAMESRKAPRAHWLPVLTKSILRNKVYWRLTQENKQQAKSPAKAPSKGNIFDNLTDECGDEIIEIWTEAELKKKKAAEKAEGKKKGKAKDKAPGAGPLTLLNQNFSTSDSFQDCYSGSTSSVGVSEAIIEPTPEPSLAGGGGPPPCPVPPHPIYGVPANIEDSGWRRVFDPARQRLGWVPSGETIKIFSTQAVGDYELVHTNERYEEGLWAGPYRQLEQQYACSLGHLLWEQAVAVNILLNGLQPAAYHLLLEDFHASLHNLLRRQALDLHKIELRLWGDTTRLITLFPADGHGRLCDERNESMRPVPEYPHHGALSALWSDDCGGLQGLDLLRRSSLTREAPVGRRVDVLLPEAYTPPPRGCLELTTLTVPHWRDDVEDIVLEFTLKPLPARVYFDARDYKPVEPEAGPWTCAVALCVGPTAPPAQAGSKWFPTLWNPVKTRPEESNKELLVTADGGLGRLSRLLRNIFGRTSVTMLQLHPDVLKEGLEIEEDSLLYSRRGDTALDARFLCDGAYNPEKVEYLRCTDANMEIEEIGRPWHAGLEYSVYKLRPIVSTKMRWVKRLLPVTIRSRLLLCGVQMRTSPVQATRLERIPGPTIDAKYRTAYALLTQQLPVKIQSTFHDNRNEEMGQEDRTGTQPFNIAQGLVKCLQDAEQLFPTAPGFAVKKRTHPVQCVSCGTKPPKKYRWKHRICGKCEDMLLHGAVSWAGAQIVAADSVGRVPSCMPGLCKKANRQYPPPAKKWESVDLEGGGAYVRFSPEMALQGRSRKTIKKYNDFVLRDLEKLKAYSIENKRQLALAGIGCSGCSPMLSAKTVYNQAKALCGRAFRTPKVAGPDDGIFEWLDQFVPILLPEFEAKAMDFDEWLKTMPSRRRGPLSDARTDYLRTGWQAKYAEFTAFVKQEKLPDFSKDDFGISKMTEMLDRLIQGPHDVTHTIVGPILKPLVKRLHEIWDNQNCIFYGSVGPQHLHEWLQRLVAKAGVYIWCDYSMYDNTHSEESWRFMERLYRRSAGDAPNFWKVMEAWRTPRGRIGPFKYKARVMNASGRDDTALANGVLNGFAAYLSACAAWLDVPLRTLTPAMVQGCRSEIILSVCGDDSLGSIPNCTQERQEKFCKDMAFNISLFGFEAKLQASTKLYDAVYLGQRPYPTEKGWFWGKTIGRSTYKMGWIIDDKQDLLAHLTGIAEMHTLCSQHVPVLSNIAEAIVRLREGAKRTPVVLDPAKPWEWTYKSGVKYDALTLEAVVAIYNCRRTPTTGELNVFDTGITIEEVRALLDEIDGIQQLPYIIRSPVWERMIWVDDL